MLRSMELKVERHQYRYTVFEAEIESQLTLR